MKSGRFKVKMPCSNCMTNYTAFRKEHGCSKCAFGFCEKCVSKKAVIPGLSSKPVSVCDSCYAKLTGQQFIPGPNLGKQQVDRDAKCAPKNWWGNDDLPPPSMRRDYMKPKPTQKANQSSNNGGSGGGSKSRDEMDEIHQRLAKLQDRPVDEVRDPRILITGKDENGKAPQGAKVLDSFKEDTPSNSKNGQKSTNKGQAGTGSITVSEIEERLAALRGLPVEVIRKPRLMVYDEDEDSDVELTDDALELLKEAERKAAGGGAVKRKHPVSYENEGLQVDEHEHVNRDSTASLDSTTFKKILKECDDTPSITSSVASSQVFPNFADQVKLVRQDALEAERQAALYIQQSEEHVPPPQHVQPFEGRRSEGNVTPETPKGNQKKNPGFFSKFFKSHSKDA